MDLSAAWQVFLAFIMHFLDTGKSVIVASAVAGLQEIERGGGALLISAVDAAVQAEEATGADGPTKFSNAVAAVKGTLVSQGETVIENAVQLAVLQGVARLRAALVTDGAAQPAS